MDIQPDFSAYYKRLSNSELLEILEDPRTCQASAIAAAKNEFSNRKLSKEEIYNAKADLRDKQLFTQKRFESRYNILHEIEKKRNSSNAFFHPNEKDISKNERKIRFITLGLSALFLIYLFRDVQTIRFFTMYMWDMPAEFVAILLPMIMLPVALILFWKRRPVGWRLLAIWLTYSSLESTVSLFVSDNSGPLDYLVPTPSLSGILVNMIIVYGTLFTICQSNIREEFTISKKNMTTVLILTVVFTFFYSFMLAVVI